MVEVGSEVSEELNKSAIKDREALVRQKQYEFERRQTLESKQMLEKKPRKPLKRYLPWAIVALVLIVLFVLVYFLI